MKEREQGVPCFLLDEHEKTVGRGMLLDPPSSRFLRVRLLEESAGATLYRQEVHLVGMNDGAESLLCRVLEQRGSLVSLERIRVVGGNLRQNLRIPVRFRTPIYPLTGPWQAQRWVESKDLSCGGVAFHVDTAMEVGEQLEIVIPITKEPLVLACQILRTWQELPGKTSHAAKFYDLCHDEESMVRQAVFSTQIRQHTGGK